MKWSLVLILVILSAACERPCFEQMVEAGYPPHCIKITVIGPTTVCSFDEAACYGEAVGPLMCSSGDGGVGPCDDGGIGEPAEECEATVDEAGNVSSVVWRDLVKGVSASLTVDGADSTVIYSDDGGGTLYAATVLNAAPGVVEMNVVGAPVKAPIKVEVGEGMVKVGAGAQSVSAPCTIKTR